MLSIDRNGFDILGIVPNPSPHSTNNSEQFLWKEFRLPFPESACDMEKFCHLLVNMEEEAIKKVSSYSGIGV
ncbi:hypothetical protein MLD38_003677 [Melastoma candidum]|nr:hypothetical protein MLD38_003677 [Melastoma candidum]